MNTSMSARGKFARVCIDLDLSKVLIPFYELEDKGQSIPSPDESFSTTRGMMKEVIVGVANGYGRVTRDEQRLGKCVTDDETSQKPQYGEWLMVTRWNQRSFPSVGSNPMMSQSNTGSGRWNLRRRTQSLLGSKEILILKVEPSNYNLMISSGIAEVQVTISPATILGSL